MAVRTPTVVFEITVQGQGQERRELVCSCLHTLATLIPIKTRRESGGFVHFLHIVQLLKLRCIGDAPYIAARWFTYILLFFPLCVTPAPGEPVCHHSQSLCEVLLCQLCTLC